MHSNSFLLIICGLFLAAVSIFAAPTAPSEGTGLSYQYEIRHPNPDGGTHKRLKLSVNKRVDPEHHAEFVGIAAGFVNSEDVKQELQDINHPLELQHIKGGQIIADKTKDPKDPRFGAMFKLSLQKGSKGADANIYFMPKEPGAAHMEARIFNTGKGEKDYKSVMYHHQPVNIPPPLQGATHNSAEHHDQPKVQPVKQRSRSESSASSVSLGELSDTWGKKLKEGEKQQHTDSVSSPEDGRKGKGKKRSRTDDIPVDGRKGKKPKTSTSS